MRIMRPHESITLIGLGLVIAGGSVVLRPDAEAQIAHEAPTSLSAREAACQQLFEDVSTYSTADTHRTSPSGEHDAGDLTVRRTVSGVDGTLAVQIDYACAFDPASVSPTSLEITVHHY